jgi:O-antigen/teichoic acid export membrane protein
MNNITKKTKNWLYQFLRKTQKYTGTDNVYLAKGGFWLTSGQIIYACAGLLLAIAFANLLDPVVYGNYKYILSIAGILGIFSLSGMKTAVIQAVARGFEGSFYSAFKTKLKYGILVSAVSIIGGVYYFLRGNELLPIPLFLMAVFLPIMYASQIYNSFLFGKKLFSEGIKYKAIIKIISTIILICVLFLTKNLVFLILAWLAIYTILNFFFFFITKQKFHPNQKEDIKTLSYGKHLSVIDFISIIADYLDKILLFTMIGASQLAVYYFATILPMYIRNTISSISALAIPKFSIRPEKEIKQKIFKKIHKLFLLTILIIIVYIISAPYVYKIFFPQYIESIIYSQVFILSLISFPVILLNSFFQSKMMKKQLYLLKIAPFLRVILFIILIPLFGIWGAITSILATEIFSIGLTLFLFKKS